LKNEPPGGVTKKEECNRKEGNKKERRKRRCSRAGTCRWTIEAGRTGNIAKKI
jgi:hypothetical protein